MRMGLINKVIVFIMGIVSISVLPAQITGPDNAGNVLLQESITGTYPWQSISTSYGGSGTVIDWSTHKLGNNAYTDAVPLGFTFDYYGTGYDSIYIMSSGWLSFTDREFIIPDTSAFPYDADPCDGVIAPFILTLDNGQADGVYFKTLGSAPRRRFVVEWSDAYATFNLDYHSFQAVFHEGGSRIEFLYGYLADYGNSSFPEPSHIGFESPDGQDGFDLGLYNQYNRPPYPTGEKTRILFGKPFSVSIGTYDGGDDVRLYWDAVTDDPFAPVALYYDDGTDTTGTLITDGLTAGDTSGYLWDVSGLAQGAGLYVYGVISPGISGTVRYAPGMLMPGVGINHTGGIVPIFAVLTVTPNPAGGRMLISGPSVINRLLISEPDGTPVRTLSRTGDSFEWDGRAADGKYVPAGLYLGTAGAGIVCRIMRIE